MNNSTKCHKCGLVNPAGDLACRRCSGVLGLAIRESLTAQKTKSPKYLVFLPFLLCALVFGIWFGKIRKSATESINMDKDEWHELTMDPKVGPRDAVPVATPYVFGKNPKEKALIEQMNKDMEAYRNMKKNPVPVRVKSLQEMMNEPQR